MLETWKKPEGQEAFDNLSVLSEFTVTTDIEEKQPLISNMTH